MRRSIRYQILAVIALIVLGAVVANVYMATSLVVNDKQAYVFDVNALLARTLSEEVNSNLSGLADKLILHAQARKPLGASDDDVLALTVYEPNGLGRYEPRKSTQDEARLAALNVLSEDLREAEDRYPLDFAVVRADGLVLDNVSLPPDLALLRLSTMDAEGNIISAVIRPDRLFHLFGKTQPHTAYLVNARGEILVHPDAKKVLNHANLAAEPLVAEALSRPGAQAVKEVEGERGALLGAYAHASRGRLSVLTEVPREEVFRATSALVNKSVLFALCIVCLAFFAGIVVSIRITRPISELMRSMTEMSKGKFGVEAKVSTRNELGDLATAFNLMSRELHQREVQLSETNAQLTQAEKLSALGEMCAGIVHEVKNPMVAVVGFAELGQMSRTPEQMKECFDHILKGAERANDILQNVLNFARPGGVKFEPIEAKAVVDGTLQLVSHTLGTKGVKVTVTSAERLPQIRGNVNQLRQVMLNLMMNAGHAMEGCAQKRLEVAIVHDPADGYVKLKVSDNGVGMPEEVQKNLFRPFFSTKERGKGTGLGLAVSRSIVEAHGGRISVESKVGVGTTFTISIPQFVAEPTAVAA